MWPSIREWERPGSVSEACRLLAEGGERTLPLAGATSLAFVKSARKERVVDLARLPLDFVEVKGSRLRLGALLTIGRLGEDDASRDWAGGILARAADHIASTPVRNLITVGGNVVQVYPWSDLPPALWALGAEFLVTGPGGDRQLTADEFFSRHPKVALGPGTLLAEVGVPELGAGETAFFETFSRTAVDFALATVAGWLGFKGGRCTGARIILSACGPLPQRLKEVEETLVFPGKKDDRWISRAVAALRSAGKFPSDFRATSDFRRHVAGVLLSRGLSGSGKGVGETCACRRKGRK